MNKFKPTNASFESLISDETYFRQKFTQFLYSPKGGIYQVIEKYKTSLNFHLKPNFWFSEPLKCGELAPDVLLQAIPYQHKRFYRSSGKYSYF